MRITTELCPYLGEIVDVSFRLDGGLMNIRYLRKDVTYSFRTEGEHCFITGSGYDEAPEDFWDWPWSGYEN